MLSVLARVSGAMALIYAVSFPVLAETPASQHDMLNAELWMRTAVEYRANCLTVYALAKTRLGEALADKSWRAYNQTGD
jgi:hypothetical protein